MIFRTYVQLGDGDSFLYTADAAAAQVLAALGGNPTKDSSTVTVQQAAIGSAGVPEAAPGAFVAPASLGPELP